MKRTRTGFVLGICLGLTIGAAGQTVAQLIVIQNLRVAPELRLRLPPEVFPSPKDKYPLGIKGSFGALLVHTDNLVAFKTIQTRQIAIQGIDLRLFCENLLGALVQNKTLSAEDAKWLIENSTVEASGFKVEHLDDSVPKGEENE